MLGHDDHDHGICRHDALKRADDRCRALGLRMTAQRRQVLDVLLARHVPLSAYDIIDRIADGGRRPSPISVYRALDFLVANRFAHRIESRNAFLACSHDHAGETGEPLLVFLLCEACGAAAEAEEPALDAILAGIATTAGFTPSSSVVEMRGVCARCRAEGRAPEAPADALSGDDA